MLKVQMDNIDDIQHLIMRAKEYKDYVHEKNWRES